jgi:hypothetical protein
MPEPIQHDGIFSEIREGVKKNVPVVFSFAFD